MQALRTIINQTTQVDPFENEHYMFTKSR